MHTCVCVCVRMLSDYLGGGGDRLYRDSLKMLRDMRVKC